MVTVRGEETEQSHMRGSRGNEAAHDGLQIYDAVCFL